jgi:aryl-alcohol dehydrogenase-like predicted oxidoreductase
MKYRKLGRTGLKVSELCLGTMLFGSHADEPTSRRIIDRARDQGVNFIDSADVYVRGKAEEIVGRAIASDRDDWVLATKLGNPMSDKPGPNQRGLSRKWIIQEAEASLKRLGTDYIDLFYVHREDPTTPIAETLHALTDLVKQGKIRYYGISNHQSWKLAEYSHLADNLGVDRPAATQLCYNAVNRQPEKEHFHITDYYGQGVVVYSPLARGVLTGKYEPDQPPPPGTRAGRNDKKMQQTEWRPESLHIAQTLRKHAEAKGVPTSEFALAWVLNNDAVTSVIAGPRTEEQWESYVRALDYVVTAEDEALVDSLVPPGHPSTPGFTDPSDIAPRRRPRTA